jgi:hypothetical protein
MPAFNRIALALCALVILPGCASSTITSRHAYQGEKLARPDHIIISDFLISASDLVKMPESGLARFLPDGVAVS